MDRKEQLREKLTKDPFNKLAGYALAMEYVDDGDDDGAVRCFRETLAICPDYWPAYYQAGQALIRLGQKEEGERVLARGVAVRSECLPGIQ